MNKKSKTIQEVAQEIYGDPNRSMFSNKDKSTILVPNVHGGTSAINLGNAEANAKFNFELEQQLEMAKQWEKNDEAIKNYNKNIGNLDPDYASVMPMARVIVRCYHLEAERTENGVYTAPRIPVKQYTQNGVGVNATFDSPWPFSTKAVLVAAPSYMTSQGVFRIGDILQVHKEVVMAAKPSADADFELPFGYTLPDYYDFQPPTSVENKHFGYLAFDPKYIITILEQFKDNNDGRNSSREPEA